MTMGVTVGGRGGRRRERGPLSGSQLKEAAASSLKTGERRGGFEEGEGAIYVQIRPLKRRSAEEEEGGVS